MGSSSTKSLLSDGEVIDKSLSVSEDSHKAPKEEVERLPFFDGLISSALYITLCSRYPQNSWDREQSLSKTARNLKPSKKRKNIKKRKISAGHWGVKRISTNHPS